MQDNIFTKMAVVKRKKEYLETKKPEEKTEILDWLVKDTNRSRKSLIRSLNNPNITERNISGRGGRKKKYTPQSKNIVKMIWQANDCICAERFHGQIEETLKDLKQANKLEGYIDSDIELVRKIPLGTLKLFVAKFPKPKRGSISSSGSVRALQKQIPVRTYFSTNIKSGFFGVDFVDHNGGNATGKFARTLVFTDPKTTWIVRSACLGKDSLAVGNAFELNKKKIPYTIEGLHSDNEPALLTSLLSSKAKENNIFITRSRSYKKEDNGHTEQKNGDKVRGLVGYRRYDTLQHIDLLNRIYEIDDQFQNHFVPSVKLKEKEFNDLGRVIKKKYDSPKSPYQRVMEEKDIDIQFKMSLASKHSKLNRLELLEERDKLLRKLTRLGNTIFI